MINSSWPSIGRLERRLSCPVRRLNIRIYVCSRAIQASGGRVHHPSTSDEVIKRKSIIQ
jgi:hypothetical protein